MSDDEKLLLKKAKTGDIESFETLVRKHQGFIFNVALKMQRNRDDAADMTQEALVKAFRNIQKFNEKSSFTTWLYRITVNVCIDEQRKRKNRKVIDIKSGNEERTAFIENIRDKSDNPEEKIIRKERIAAVWDAIDLLPDSHKSIIILRDIKGLGYDEIGDILSLPNGTVKSRINRARQKLKNLLVEKRELFSDDNVKVIEKEVRQ